MIRSFIRKYEPKNSTDMVRFCEVVNRNKIFFMDEMNKVLLSKVKVCMGEGRNMDPTWVMNKLVPSSITTSS